MPDVILKGDVGHALDGYEIAVAATCETHGFSVLICVTPEQAASIAAGIHTADERNSRLKCVIDHFAGAVQAMFHVRIGAVQVPKPPIDPSRS
jgi:hypothetical protein